MLIKYGTIVASTSHKHITHVNLNSNLEFTVRLSEFKNEKAVQIIIDNEILTTLTKTFKEPTESGILTGKKKLDVIFTDISKRLACIKRHFFASPFEMMLIATKANF